MSFPTEPVSTEKLDEGTDSPKEARDSLYQAVQKLNAAISSVNQALGVCVLNADSKIDSSLLEGAVDANALQSAVVNADKLANQAVTFLKLKATLTADTSEPTGGNDGDFWFIYE